MRYLGIDYGEKRIGVAVTDPLGWTVQPVATINRRRIEQDLEDIVCFAQDYGVQVIVVGLPLRGDDGEVGIQAKKVLKFCEQLRAYCVGRGTEVDIETWDESMTTSEAEDILRQTKATAKRRKKLIDQLAAAMILQSYLAAKKEEEEFL